MVKVISFPLLHCVVFFVWNFSHDVTGVRSSISEAAASGPAIENEESFTKERVKAFLVPFDDAESRNEHHKSKRCWRSRPVKKIRVFLDPGETGNDNYVGTESVKGNRKNDNDLYEGKKRSVRSEDEEEYEGSWESNESWEENLSNKVPLLKIVPVKNSRKNLNEFLGLTPEDSSDFSAEENPEHAILRNIKNHLQSDDYNVLALVGKRAAHSSPKKRNKYICYCRRSDCANGDCRRIIYKPCSTCKYSKMNSKFPKDRKSYFENQGPQARDERTGLRIQYPETKNQFIDYPMNNVQLFNNPGAFTPSKNSLNNIGCKNIQQNSVLNQNPKIFSQNPSSGYSQGSGIRNANEYRYGNYKPTQNWYYPLVGNRGNPGTNNQNHLTNTQNFINPYQNYGGLVGATIPFANQRVFWSHDNKQILAQAQPQPQHFRAPFKPPNYQKTSDSSSIQTSSQLFSANNQRLENLEEGDSRYESNTGGYDLSTEYNLGFSESLNKNIDESQENTSEISSYEDRTEEDVNSYEKFEENFNDVEEEDNEKYKSAVTYSGKVLGPKKNPGTKEYMNTPNLITSENTNEYTIPGAVKTHGNSFTDNANYDDVAGHSIEEINVTEQLEQPPNENNARKTTDLENKADFLGSEKSTSDDYSDIQVITNGYFTSKAYDEFGEVEGDGNPVTGNENHDLNQRQENTHCGNSNNEESYGEPSKNYAESGLRNENVMSFAEIQQDLKIIQNITGSTENEDLGSSNDGKYSTIASAGLNEPNYIKSDGVVQSRKNQAPSSIGVVGKQATNSEKYDSMENYELDSSSKEDTPVPDENYLKEVNDNLLSSPGDENDFEKHSQIQPIEHNKHASYSENNSVEFPMEEGSDQLVGNAENDKNVQEHEAGNYYTRVNHEPENSPTRYFSPHDRVLEYIKKHSQNLVADADPRVQKPPIRDPTATREEIHHTKHSRDEADEQDFQGSNSAPESDEILTKPFHDADHRYDIQDANSDQQTAVDFNMSQELPRKKDGIFIQDTLYEVPSNKQASDFGGYNHETESTSFEETRDENFIGKLGGREGASNQQDFTATSQLLATNLAKHSQDEADEQDFQGSNSAPESDEILTKPLHDADHRYDIQDANSDQQTAVESNMSQELPRKKDGILIQDTLYEVPNNKQASDFGGYNSETESTSFEETRDENSIGKLGGREGESNKQDFTATSVMPLATNLAKHSQDEADEQDFQGSNSAPESDEILTKPLHDADHRYDIQDANSDQQTAVESNMSQELPRKKDGILIQDTLYEVPNNKQASDFGGYNSETESTSFEETRDENSIGKLGGREGESNKQDFTATSVMPLATNLAKHSQDEADEQDFQGSNSAPESDEILTKPLHDADHRYDIQDANSDQQTAVDFNMSQELPRKKDGIFIQDTLYEVPNNKQASDFGGYNHETESTSFEETRDENSIGKLGGREGASNKQDFTATSQLLATNLAKHSQDEADEQDFQGSNSAPESDEILTKPFHDADHRYDIQDANSDQQTAAESNMSQELPRKKDGILIQDTLYEVPNNKQASDFGGYNSETESTSFEETRDENSIGRLGGREGASNKQDFTATSQLLATNLAKHSQDEADEQDFQGSNSAPESDEILTKPLHDADHRYDIQDANSDQQTAVESNMSQELPRRKDGILIQDALYEVPNNKQASDFGGYNSETKSTSFEETRDENSIGQLGGREGASNKQDFTATSQLLATNLAREDDGKGSRDYEDYNDFGRYSPKADVNEGNKRYEDVYDFSEEHYDVDGNGASEDETEDHFDNGKMIASEKHTGITKPGNVLGNIQDPGYSNHDKIEMTTKYETVQDSEESENDFYNDEEDYRPPQPPRNSFKTNIPSYYDSAKTWGFTPLGNSREFKTGLNNEESGITHLKNRLSSHDYNFADSTESSTSTKELVESCTHYSEENSYKNEYTRDDKKDNTPSFAEKNPEEYSLLKMNRENNGFQKTPSNHYVGIKDHSMQFTTQYPGPNYAGDHNEHRIQYGTEFREENYSNLSDENFAARGESTGRYNPTESQLESSAEIVTGRSSEDSDYYRTRLTQNVNDFYSTKHSDVSKKDGKYSDRMKNEFVGKSQLTGLRELNKNFKNEESEMTHLKNRFSSHDYNFADSTESSTSTEESVESCTHYSEKNSYKDEYKQDNKKDNTPLLVDKNPEEYSFLELDRPNNGFEEIPLNHYVGIENHSMHPTTQYFKPNYAEDQNERSIQRGVEFEENNYSNLSDENFAAHDESAERYNPTESQLKSSSEIVTGGSSEDPNYYRKQLLQNYEDFYSVKSSEIGEKDGKDSGEMRNVEFVGDSQSTGLRELNRYWKNDESEMTHLKNGLSSHDYKFSDSTESSSSTEESSTHYSNVNSPANQYTHHTKEEKAPSFSEKNPEENASLKMDSEKNGFEKIPLNQNVRIENHSTQSTTQYPAPNYAEKPKEYRTQPGVEFKEENYSNLSDENSSAYSASQERYNPTESQLESSEDIVTGSSSEDSNYHRTQVMQNYEDFHSTRSSDIGEKDGKDSGEIRNVEFVGDSQSTGLRELNRYWKNDESEMTHLKNGLSSHDYKFSDSTESSPSTEESSTHYSNVNSPANQYTHHTKEKKAPSFSEKNPEENASLKMDSEKNGFEKIPLNQNVRIENHSTQSTTQYPAPNYAEKSKEYRTQPGVEFKEENYSNLSDENSSAYSASQERYNPTESQLESSEDIVAGSSSEDSNYHRTQVMQNYEDFHSTRSSDIGEKDGKDSGEMRNVEFVGDSQSTGLRELNRYWKNDESEITHLKNGLSSHDYKFSDSTESSTSTEESAESSTHWSTENSFVNEYTRDDKKDSTPYFPDKNPDEYSLLEMNRENNGFEKTPSNHYVKIEDHSMQLTTQYPKPNYAEDQKKDSIQNGAEFKEENYSNLSDENFALHGESTGRYNPTESQLESAAKIVTGGCSKDSKNYRTLVTQNVDDLHPTKRIDVEEKDATDFDGSKSIEFVGNSQFTGSIGKPTEVVDDPGYLGRLAPKKSTSDVKSFADLIDSDLYYIGDGVRLPLTIKKLKDGSFALSISDKICEQRLNKKCPCCVPREGEILQERRSKENQEEGLEESIEETDSTGLHRRAISEDEKSAKIQHHNKRITRSISMPVDEFAEKYNLILNLTDPLPDRNVIPGDAKSDETLPHDSELIQRLKSINDVPENERTEVLLSILREIFAKEPTEVFRVINGIRQKLGGVKSADDEIEEARYGYQRDNPILERIKIIKGLQKEKTSRCEHKYQKDCDDAITQKTELLTIILYWLKNLVLSETN